MPDDQRVYTYEQVAELLYRGLQLPTKPKVVTLRSYQARRHIPVTTNAVVAVATGMPTPVPGRRGHPVFDAEQIEQWIAHHPRRQRQAAQQALVKSLSRVKTDKARIRAVATAHAAGLSWQEIADAFTATDGVPRSRQWAHDRYSSAVS